MQENKQEKSPIKQKILLYLAKKGVTQYEFYKESGVTRGILQQNNGISEDNISRFLAYAPDINADWLLTGRGDMLKEASEQRVSEVAHPVPAGTHAGIPLIPLNAMAGAFTGDLSVLDYECEHYVIPDFQGADFLIRVKGDSMQPTYYAGDLIACQHVPLDDLFFQWGKAYVLDTTQGPLIKRIRPGKDNEHLLIISDNTAYPPFELARDQFHGVALVRGLVRLE